jgi:hypothetical protein
MFVLPILALARHAGAGQGGVFTRAGLTTFCAFAGFALTDCMFDRQISFIAFFLVGGWLLRAAASEHEAA